MLDIDRPFITKVLQPISRKTEKIFRLDCFVWSAAWMVASVIFSLFLTLSFILVSMENPNASVFVFDYGMILLFGLRFLISKGKNGLVGIRGLAYECRKKKECNPELQEERGSMIFLVMQVLMTMATCMEIESFGFDTFCEFILPLTSYYLAVASAACTPCPIAQESDTDQESGPGGSDLFAS